MRVSDKDKSVIRELARRVAEIAADPIHDEKRALWKRLNNLERVRPLIHVQAIDWNIWEELIPADQLVTTDPSARPQELELRKRIYCWEVFRDDRVVDDVINCQLVLDGDIIGTGFGLQKNLEKPAEASGAHKFLNILDAEEDIEKIQTESHVQVDWEETEARYEELCDLYEGILRVEKRGPDFFWFGPMDQFIQWRGIEQMFVDLMERPQWVHKALERITAGYMSDIEEIERQDLLSPGNGNTRLGSGGYGWTESLPQPDYDGRHVRLRDIWARAATQIFTEGISPAMHDEFAIDYEKRLLERFGLSCYGCCEPLHKKMHVVRKIQNLRRVSMSPWVDVERAAAEVGADYVYTHKPNPSILSMPSWDPDLSRQQLGDAFEKTKENIVEVNLQDLHTVRNEPRRLSEWTEIAMELSEQYA